MTPIYAAYKRPTSEQKIYTGWKWRNGKHIPHKRTWKKTGVAILISDKIKLQTKAITRDKEGHFLILKEVVQQEDITLVNIYTPNKGVPKYMNKILEDFKKEIDSTTVTVGDFNTPLSITQK